MRKTLDEQLKKDMPDGNTCISMEVKTQTGLMVAI